jgi:hypothetical protein
MHWFHLASLLLIGPADAARIAYTRPQLCSFSDTVVIAEVTGTEVRWSAGPEGGIETVVWLSPRATIRGVAPVALVLPGGRIGDLTLTVEDVPHVEVDSTYLFLLRNTPDGPLVVGGEEGAVPIELDGNPGEPPNLAIHSLGDCSP